MIKKLLSVFVVLVMIMSMGIVALANESLQNLQSLGVAPLDITDKGLSQTASRELFAYMTARMLSAGSLKPQATVFSDVDETNNYSGYIAFLNQRGIISGSGDGLFNPEGTLTTGAASKILVTVLGYKDIAEKNGGYQVGYEIVATDLGLYNNVKHNDGVLTIGGAVEMINNALSAPMASAEYFATADGLLAGVTKDESVTILNSVLGLNAYHAIVDDVNQAKGVVSVTITKNKYKTNKVVLNSGDKKVFAYNSNVNPAGYKYAPVVIMVDADENVVSMIPTGDAEVRITTVSSVNGNYDEKSYAYKVSEIKRITFADDETEYDVAEDFKVFFNEKAETNSVSLIGKPARVIFKDGEVSSIESWDLTEGGFITSANVTEITYTKGENEGYKLKDFSNYKNQYVYIDGRSATIADIKPKSVFYYRADEDNLVIVVSERMAVDILFGISQKELEIGGFAFAKGDYVYYKADDKGFRKNIGADMLLGNNVKAYFAPNGNVLYVEALDGSVVTNETFLGIITGFETDNFDEEIMSLKLMKFKPEVSEDVYTLNEKTVLSDGITRDEIKRATGQISSSYVYEFETRADGRVSSIKRPLWFSGYGETVEKSVSSFAKDALMTVNGKAMFFKNQLTIVDKTESGIKAKNVSYSSLASRSVSCNLAFFVLSANEFASLPDLIFVYGKDGKPIGEIANSSYPKRGIMYKKEETIDEEGERCIEISVQVGSKAYTYQITHEEAAGLSDCAYITFTDVYTADDSYISITENRDLTKPYDEWYVVSGYTSSGWHRGIVEKVDTHRIATRDVDGTIDINFYHTSSNFFLELDKTKPQPIVKTITSKDIMVGDKVYYNLTSEGLKGVILVRE